MADMADYLAHKIAYEMNFVPFDETMYEYWEIDEDDKVLRIANTKFSSRVHFLVDLAEWEW